MPEKKNICTCYIPVYLKERLKGGFLPINAETIAAPNPFRSRPDLRDSGSSTVRGLTLLYPTVIVLVGATYPTLLRYCCDGYPYFMVGTLLYDPGPKELNHPDCMALFFMPI